MRPECRWRPDGFKTAPDPITGLSVRQWSRSANWRISSEELTKLCLERIRKHDPKLNAFLTLTADSLSSRRGASDHDLQKGVIHGPLHGVPIALKDNIDTSGVLTTAASKVFADRVPSEDAEVAKRVKRCRGGDAG